MNYFNQLVALVCAFLFCVPHGTAWSSLRIECRKRLVRNSNLIDCIEEKNQEDSMRWFDGLPQENSDRIKNFQLKKHKIELGSLWIKEIRIPNEATLFQNDLMNYPLNTIFPPKVLE